MKKILSMLLVLSTFLGCAVGMTSCSDDDEGAEISIYLSDVIYDFDPTEVYTDDNAVQVMSMLYEPLFSISESGKLEKAAAKKYKVYEDERKIVIELRETYWSDSTRLEAQNFIYAWTNRVLNPTRGNSSAVLLYDIVGAVEINEGKLGVNQLGAYASDTYEITIEYREGADYEQLLRNLASISLAPVKENAVMNGDSYWSKSASTIITNGPFKIYSLDYDTGTFTLQRNVGYHKDPFKGASDKYIKPNKLMTFWLEDDGTLATAQQQLDSSDVEKCIFYMGNMTLEQRAANIKNAVTADTLSTYSYLFNTTNPLFANENVRKALSMAIDRNAIISKVVFGKPATGLIPGTVGDYKKTFREMGKDLISASADIEGAKALLSSVSLPDTVSKNIKITFDDNEEGWAIFNIVKSAWESLGFGLTVEANAVSFTETEGIIDSVASVGGEVVTVTIKDSTIQQIYKNACQNGVYDFDVLAIDYQMFTDDAFTALASLSSNYNGNGMKYTYTTDEYGNKTLVSVSELTNACGFTDTEYDKLIDEAFKASDPEQRSALLHQAEEYLIGKMPLIPIMFNQNFYIKSKALKNIDVDGFGNFIFNEVSLKNYENYLGKNAVVPSSKDEEN